MDKKIIEQIREHALYAKDKKIVLGRGVSSNVEFLIFGEAPGKRENQQGEPFVGRSGAVLDHWLNVAQVTSYYISNVVPLMPLNPQGKIRKPTNDERIYFKFFVNWMLQKVKPKCVIVLGDSAAKALTGKDVNQIKGKVDRIGNIPLAGIYHPARYMRRGEHKTTGSRDFCEAVNLLRRSSGGGTCLTRL